MTTPSAKATSTSTYRFGLKEIFELTTLCCILASLSTLFGNASSFYLMVMAVAVWLRQGAIALAMLVVACLSVDETESLDRDSEIFRIILLMFVATGICMWYEMRRRVLTNG